MRRATPYPYTMPFGHGVDKTFRSGFAGHEMGRDRRMYRLSESLRANSAATWLDARRIWLLAFDNCSNLAVGRS